jgi:hypothetical protein
MSEFPGDLLPTQIAGLQVWVFGAQQEQPEPWSEVRLTAAIGQYLSQGLPIKEISQKLAVNSGWPRRQIYHKCVQLVKRDRDEEGERKARPGGA